MSTIANIKRLPQLKSLVKEYNDLYEQCKPYVKDYEKMRTDLQSAAEGLLHERTVAVRELIKLDSYIHSIKSCPSILSTGMQTALGFTKWFQEGFDLSRYGDQTTKEVKGAKYGASAGGALLGAGFSAAGPSVAMAFATTFGTAGTGVAISSLSGVAATNAALAWLGGGALAAGGAGVAGGHILLAVLGPVGIGVSVISLAFGLSKAAKQISEYEVAIQKNKDFLDKVPFYIKEGKRMISEIDTLKRKTICFTEDINCEKFIEHNDFDNSSFPKEELCNAVEKAKTLGKMIKEIIS